ncbi:hypothetical protein U9M48_018049 [Paspalum notatum var. saurae]|uniref:Uncharacterized protein n=1 Tax=Paspalum notatum var. saurae TaxID=547442 RepID=A0AAQ3T9C5_PASNO
MAAHLTCLPVSVFVFIIFLGVHAPFSHGSPAPAPLPLITTYDPSICSETFWCGSVNISYPFYLSNATREITTYHTSNYSCGYTDLEITCQGERPKATPVIRLGGDSYTVLNISYDNHTITLAETDVLSDARCPAVRHNVSFSEVWLRDPSSDVNLTFVFDCKSDVPQFYTRNTKYRIDCDGVKSPFGGEASFVFTPDDDDDDAIGKEHELATIYCSEVISVPVVNSSFLVMASNNKTMFTSGGYGDVLKHGFELIWSYATTNDQCQPCEQSGGRCAYSQDKEFLSCLCSDGKASNPNCTIPASSGNSVSPDPSLFAINQTMQICAS